MIDEDILVILIAPNVGEQMGGEAMKALQIFREIKKVHRNTIQITHERNRSELTDRLQMPGVYYVADTKLAIALWRSRIFQWLVNPWFSHQAIRVANSIAAHHGLKGSRVIIHQTEPNSPVVPRAVSSDHPNVFGPINGNIYYPKAFRRSETISARLRRMFHMPCQRMNRWLFRGITKADFILSAGGQRTANSLLAAGCDQRILVESLDCGVADDILNRARIIQRGVNGRFVHFGRLVFHKGTSLIIEALQKTDPQVCLDIIGTGPELERCKQLVSALELSDRVRFVGWFADHKTLLDSFEQYRGTLLPSLEDANGIVVQEAQALGLPCICLDWGGPQLLIEDGITGFLINPQSKDHIVEKLAECMNCLARDGALAERMSVAAKSKAEDWRWSKVVSEWLYLYGTRLSGTSA